jgi:hypothetical protein
MHKSHVSKELQSNVKEISQWIQEFIDSVEGEQLPDTAYRMFNRCTKVFNDLLDGKVAIPVYEKDEKGVGMPVVEKKINRKAIISVLVVKYLKQLVQEFPERKHWFHDRIVALSQRANTHPVLMPDHMHGANAASGGFREHGAKDFFENTVSSVLRRLDDLYPRAEFLNLVPDTYDHTDPVNVDSWSYAWSRATAAVATNWLQHEGGNSIHEICTFLLAGGSNSLVPKKRGIATLPSDDPHLRLALTASPLLCQVLHHNPSIGDAAKEVIYLKPKYFGSEPIGGVNYTLGRGLIDIYLTTWIESVEAQFLDTHDETIYTKTGLEELEQLIMDSNKALLQLPPTLVGHVSAGQTLTVSALINPDRKKSGAGVYFSQNGGSGEILAESEVFELSSRRLKATAAFDKQAECIGSVKLDVAAVSSAHDQWLSLALIVRFQGSWYAVDLEIEEDEDQDDLLWLSNLSTNSEPWPMDALHNAFASAKWVYRLAGLGMFVAGSVDLDAKPLLANRS